MSELLRFVGLSSLLAFSGLLPAQEDADALPVPGGGADPWLHEGALAVEPLPGRGLVPVGRGAGYRATFECGAMEFLPALGATAPRDLPLRLRLLGVARGAAATGRLPLVPTWSVEGLRVAAVRGDLEERYDVRGEGVEHSLVLSSLPAGDGDLVVRIGVETELPPVGPDRSRDELRWEWPELGGVKVGAVTAIDAVGARIRGALRRTPDGELHYVIPAAFVAAAALPLTIDPLIGSTLNIMNSASADAQPDIAYNEATRTYLVVWTRTFSVLSAEIRGRMLDQDARLTGPSIVNVSAASVVNQKPKVGAISSSRSFVVAWEHSALVGTQADVWARGVRATDGRLTTNTVRITTASSVSDEQIDVGSETGIDDEALVVWSSGGDIEGAQVNVRATNNQITFVGRRTILDFADPLTNPSISTRTDASDFLVVAYERQRLSKSIDAQLVTSALAPVGSPLIVRSQTGRDCLDPAIAGDGLDWVVAYEIREAPGRDSFDIECRPLSVRTSARRMFAAALPQVVEAGVDDDEYDPAVAWGRNAAIVGYTDAASGNAATVFVGTIDPYTCLSCEPRQAAFTFDGAGGLALAWGRASFRANIDAVAVWGQSASNGNITGRGWEADHGVAFERSSSSGCGNGARLVAGCPRAGHPEFQIEARGLPPNQPVFLVVAPRRFLRALDNCGGCVLVPDPFQALIVGGTSDPLGRHSVRAPLPAGPLPTFYAQWLWAGTNCPLWSIDLSVGMEVSP